MENYLSTDSDGVSSQSPSLLPIPIAIGFDSTSQSESGPSPDCTPKARESEVQIDENNDKVQVGGKRQVSAVWNHFKKTNINEQWKAICNYCGKKLSAKTSDGTSHLHKHYSSCPRRPYRDIRQQLLIKEQKKVDGSTDLWSNYHFDPEKTRKDLASMVIVHEYPLSIVDHYLFREYSADLQPLFKVPSRNTLKKDIVKIYGEEKIKNMELIEKVKGRIALTTDLWTASNQNKGYMAITAHYIDDNWVMQSHILR